MTWRCPLCDNPDHDRCEFWPGYLHCVLDDCDNPHHRPMPHEDRQHVAGCTCHEYDVEDDCGCLACAEWSRAPAGCPHRLDRIVAGEASNGLLYDGMCNDCFTAARDVRACGLRVAEHEYLLAGAGVSRD